MPRPIALLLILLPLATRAQVTPTIQDCLGAISVCQQIYFEALSPSGDGNYNNEINTSISCTDGELNSIWYSFTVDQSGDFGFLITPNNLNDDYDWSLFNITNASCSDILSDPSLIVSCNAAGGGSCNGLTGATGASIYNLQGAGCNYNPPTIDLALTAFNELIPVEAGNTYVLMVSNWTGSTNGYTIDFGLSTGIGIFDNTPPTVASLTGPKSCGDQVIDLVFSEYIDCETIDGANFQLSGPGGPYTLTLDGNNCDIGATLENTFSLTIDPPISSMGTFTLSISPAPSFPLQDLCGNPITDLELDFVVDVPINITVDIGNDTAILCVGQTLQLNAFTQGGSYQWEDGSTIPTFLVSQPGVYSVTVTDACGTGSDSIGITYIMDIPQVDLGGPYILCEGETLLLDAFNEFSIYSWQNGSTADSFTVSQEGNYAVTVTNACGSAADQTFVNLIPLVELDLGDEIVACEGDIVTLNAVNEDATYLWQNGLTTPIIQALTNGVYSVTVTTPCETRSDSVNLVFIAEAGPEIGQDTFLCEGDTIFLDATLPGATSYQWQDGFAGPVYAATQGGDYSVSIETVCNTFDDALYIYFIPAISFDLGRDTFLCDAELLLDARTRGPASYEWQDGFDEALYIVKSPGEYRVRVYNECETVMDTILVKECENCSFYYPNVFTPNFDGINDTFRPFPECPPEQYHFRIFDRWGSLVFESRDPAQGWDGTFRGKPAGSGTYVWSLEYTVIENNRPRTEQASGDVALIR
jgi:gliding motility-associated-like protein